MADIPGWQALGSAFLGYGAALVTEVVRDARAGARGREERADARRVAREERRNEFQRETLTALADVLAGLARVTGRTAEFLERELSAAETIGDIDIPEELAGDEALRIHAEVAKLTARVIDSDARRLAAKAQDLCIRVVMTPRRPGERSSAVKAALDTAFRAAMDGMEEAQQEIGARLRELYV